MLLAKLLGLWYKGIQFPIGVLSKVTVEISTSTHRALRLLSVIQSKTITVLVTEAIERLVADNSDQIPPIASNDYSSNSERS
jgi:hypothetical protein